MVHKIYIIPIYRPFRALGEGENIPEAKATGYML